MSNKIIILTGEIQTGKTSFLQQFCAQRNNVGGILTPIVNGKRMFYDIAGKLFFDMEADETEEKLAVGKYLFSAAAFEKANQLLLNAGRLSAIDYLVIDEIGPLELKQRKGLHETFMKILSSIFNYTLIIVVRQSLVEELIKTFNLSNEHVMSVSEMTAYFESAL